MFAGQMACEALNFGLKRLIREERPQRKDNRTIFDFVILTISRNAWQGIWDALITLPICDVLCSITHHVAAISTCTHINHELLAFDTFGKSTVVTAGMHGSWSCGCKPGLSQLSYSKAGIGWCGCWSCLCYHLVSLHDFAKEMWCDRLGFGDLDITKVSISRPDHNRRHTRCWLGSVGDSSESEAKH